LGHASIAEVRQGKFFEIVLAPVRRASAPNGRWRDRPRRAGQPVIEEYRVEFFE